MNCVDRIFAHAQVRPEHPALVFAREVVTYGQLRQRTEATAGVLTAAGVTGGRVGLFCPDGLDYVLLCLAILRTGGCVIPIAGELSLLERHKVLETTAVEHLVIGPGAVWDVATTDAEPPGLSKVEGFRAGSWSGQHVTIPWPGATAPVRCVVNLRGAGAAEPEFDTAALAAMNVAFIRFSSGTTGTSKGVILSHERLHQRITAANTALGITPADRVIWILPMAHHFAVSMMLYLMHGATILVVKSHLAGDVIAMGREHEGTVLYASPFHHAMLAGDAGHGVWPRLRLAVSTAFALTAGVAQTFHQRLGVPLCQALGVIEAGLPLINMDHALDKPESIGRPVGGFAVQLRDEAGRVIDEAPGVEQVGELCLRGPGMLDGYLSPWQPGAQALTDGWFRTGDWARRDADGDYFLVGRKKSVINVAGLKCFPEEIEAVLREHPLVREARITGRPHPRMGAVPVAEIVAVDPAHPPAVAQLMEHCKPRLAAYKRPLTYAFVAALDKTASGKIKR